MLNSSYITDDLVKRCRCNLVPHSVRTQIKGQHANNFERNNTQTLIYCLASSILALVMYKSIPVDSSVSLSPLIERLALLQPLFLTLLI